MSLLENMPDAELAPLLQQVSIEPRCDQQVRSDDLEDIWAALSTQLSPMNANSIIYIQGMVFACIAEKEVELLLIHYQFTTSMEGMLVRDSSVNRVILGPRPFMEAQYLLYVAGQLPVLMQAATATSPSSTISSVPTPPADEVNTSSPSNKPAKIPRPPNAFIIYRKVHHAEIVAQNPGVHNNDISIIIGKMWNAESEDVRALYKAQSEKLKQEHLRLHPDYSYKPRKPSEKKKRMSKKKAAAMAMASELAAANRIKSAKVVSQYAEFPQPVAQVHSQVINGQHIRQMPLPLPSNMPVKDLDQLLQFGTVASADDEDTGTALAYHFGPSAAYQTAQTMDQSFFPDIDQALPDFKTLATDVGEAFLGGYYDDVIFDPVLPTYPDDGYMLT